MPLVVRILNVFTSKPRVQQPNPAIVPHQVETTLNVFRVFDRGIRQKGTIKFYLKDVYKGLLSVGAGKGTAGIFLLSLN